MSIEMIEAPTIERSARVLSRNRIEVKAWADEPNLLTGDVNLSMVLPGAQMTAHLSPHAARELAAALLLCADAVEGV